MTDTRQSHREHALRSADRDFATHELTVEQGEGLVLAFKVTRPKTWMYGFHIVFGPGFVVITGDIGDRILRPHDFDSMAWLFGARDSIDYVIEKMTERPETFLEGDAEEFLREHKEIEVDEDESLPPGLAFSRACWFAGVDEPPSCTDYDFRTLYLAHALRRFCELYEAHQEREAG